MEATEAFKSILDSVMSSQLNFNLQLSPFSAVISLKKSLIKAKSGNPLPPPSTTLLKLRSENDLQEQNNLLAVNSITDTLISRWNQHFTKEVKQSLWDLNKNYFE